MLLLHHREHPVVDEVAGNVCNQGCGGYSGCASEHGPECLLAGEGIRIGPDEGELEYQDHDYVHCERDIAGDTAPSISVDFGKHVREDIRQREEDHGPYGDLPERQTDLLVDDDVAQQQRNGEDHREYKLEKTVTCVDYAVFLFHLMRFVHTNI